MKKVIFLFVLIALMARTSSQQMQLPVIQFDMNEFMAQQQQHAQEQARAHPMPPPQPMIHQIANQQQQGREAYQMQEDEHMVGSPLGGLFSPLNPYNPFGLGGLPGLRFSNIQAGHLGGLHFGNALLGAGNPMEAEAEGNMQVGRKHKHHKHYIDEQEVGSPQHFDSMNAEPQVGAQNEQGFIKAFGGFGFPWHHWVEEVGAPPMQQQYNAEALGPQQQMPVQEFEVAAPPMHHFNADAYAFGPQQYMPAQEFEVAAPPMQHIEMQPFEMQPMGPMHQQNFPMIPQQAEDGARTWGKWGKGNNKGYDDYGHE